jgi:hypothetical protein
MIAAIQITLVANFAKRRMKMNEKFLDVLTATAIGVGFAVLLVAWWSS